MSTRHLVCGLLFGLTLFASEASAQPTASQSPSDSWQFQFVPYLWGSGVDGQVGVGNRTADVDASFRTILKHLHFAAMGLAEARRDRFIAATDVFFTDLRDHRATPGPLFSSVNPRQRMLIFTPEAGYRLLEIQGGSIDVVGGVRVWHTRTELRFQPGLLPGINVQGSRTWVDAIGGVRARKDLPKRWWASAYGDLGGGGSNFTYQIVGTAGLDFHKHYAVTFGYRVLSVDYDKDDFLLDTALKGPLVGFTFKFPRQ